jgi:hypothetical protein
MSLSLMDQDPTGATTEARTTLASVLESFDAALARSRSQGEQPPGPEAAPPDG